VPPGLFKTLKPLIAQHTKNSFYLAALPEFLKEGTAVHDTLHPDRIIVGAEEPHVFQVLEKLYQPYGAPIVKVNPQSAQMIKYTANAYLATRITFINQIADLCEHNGANIDDVIKGIGHDQRIGAHYWYPGLGYGGSCFPKDVKELAAYAKKAKESNNLMIKIDQLNEQRIPKLLKQYAKITGGWKNKIVAVLGLSFKPHTNDTRDAPALKIIPELLKKGAIIQAYDPKATWQPESNQNKYTQLRNLKDTLNNADVIISLIEWPEIIKFNFIATKLTKKQVFIDTRNQFDHKKLITAGYIYQGIGKK
jgi:UDPglucose 6-dehydrogenase